MPDDLPWSTALYADLCRLAEAIMAGERVGHPLEPNALAHEAWLRLLHSRNAATLGRTAFLGLAAQAMRRTLTEEARQRNTAKRGGGMQRDTIDSIISIDECRDLDMDLKAALAGLGRIDIDLARIVRLRFYRGYSTQEIAERLGTSSRTVKRRWRFARAWLRQYMEEGAR